VIFVNDNSADTDGDSIPGENMDALYNWPNGTEIRHTYLMAKQFGLTRMPFIPDVATFTRQGLDKRASVFGCRDRNVSTVVFLPNAPYNVTAHDGITPLQGNQYTIKTDYNATEQADMLAYGQRVATQDGDREWPLALACIVTHKHIVGGRVSPVCEARLKKYCYVG
jgi:lysophospholipase